jgi:surfactin synthase thioesterase subunit/acyl carrier protein/NAD(P)-dependent dehydrogenase (short-subunit alcohol dehydrogenase family)
VELPARLPRVRGNASYLVTGGLGMLGCSVSKWLISKGAKHLVLTGRNANSKAAQEVFSNSEINGAEIRVVAADISREEDVSRLLQTISNELPPLRGVVQSAGVLDDGILAQLDWDRFASLFEPRVYGSWLLHEYTKSLELDFFVLNSSLWTLLGSAGQANYTASSTFLDSLAACRRIAGLPATVINWCAWSGGGLATVSGARGEAMLSSLGMKFVSPNLATEMFDKLMHRDVDQIAIAIVDWPTYSSKMGKSSFLAELLNTNENSRTSKLAQGKVVLNTRRIAANGQAREQLLSRLQQHITAKLGFAEAIDPDQPLNEIGLDSLMSVSLSNSLEDEFGIPVPIAELISGPTINQLVDTIFRELVGTFPTERNDPSGTTALAGQNAIERGAAIRQTAANNEHPSSAMWTAPAETLRSPLRFPAELKQHAKIAGGEPADQDDTENFGPCADTTNERALRTARKWLIAPVPRPTAKARLFCFPYAGGGLVSFRAWAPLLDESIEIVAVEPPGRGTRINETPIENMDTFVERLLPEMLESLDRPSVFFGHCLGGLTMFATLCALPKGPAQFIKHVFACGVRPPHLLKRRGEFEDDLVYDMILHRDFDIRVPPYGQVDEIFADIIRHFDTPAADKMLRIPKLRQVLLPTIRAEFGMAYKYDYQPVQPFSFPISSFVGDLDPWVSEEDAAGWGELTCARFTNHVRKGSHFLMVEDREYILATINDEFVKLANE